ncbi:hypothetical protein [Belnapia moabensis]|uniref:hypothetical protein n=1 Tax=Belnapia moabensis TaxID=365533 RepID=UPI0005BB113E|nr:hypothetical protein [Belnapia moabensis]
MFGSETLDVVVGIVLIFLLTSLFLTALVEVIESALKTRAADLERAVTLLFQETPASKEATEAFYNHPLVFALFQGDYEKSRTSLFFGRETGGNLPSYIPRDIFSAVVLDLQSAGSVSSGVNRVVEKFRQLYGDDVATLRTNLESWYDGMMDRAAGWYKRRTQKLLFWLGLSLAVALNINPIVIAQHLSATPAAREQIVSLASNIAAEELPRGGPSRERLRLLDQEVRNVGLPIGWSEFALSRTLPQGEFALGSWFWATIIALFGWAITAIAATLGAPFWFDVLNKLMVIRATVKPREKSRDEASEDRSRSDRKTDVILSDASHRLVGGAVAGVPLAGGADAAHLSDPDGCLAGHDVPEEQVTHDVELPPAKGGIEGRDKGA